MEKCRSKSVAAILFLALIFLVCPAASFAQGQSVFGPKDFRIGMMHFHLSVHPFNVEGGGDGVILVTKKTPQNTFEGGFLLLNSQIIALHDFLEGLSGHVGSEGRAFRPGAGERPGEDRRPAEVFDDSLDPADSLPVHRLQIL